MTFSWKVLGYSPCSASCLGGIQEAMIQCVRDYDQRIATPVLCMDKAQPDIATTRTCNDHPCPPRWNVTEFGVCSKPCGGGVMTREVINMHCQSLFYSTYQIKYVKSERGCGGYYIVGIVRIQ